jgi:sarcosine oxidase subunit alpha
MFSGDLAEPLKLIHEHPVLPPVGPPSINFTYNGRSISAFEGQSVAGALYAAGVRIFSRSFKYHRPRGLLCCQSACPNCLMNVDGRPNVRICGEPAQNGMQVRHQNARPSPEFDLFGVLDKADRFMPVGFYYKTMIRPKFSWKLAEPIIRRIAGLGEIKRELPTSKDAYGRFEKVNLHADVAVVGGGPSGSSAALEAARHGLDVILIDNQERLGGHLRTEIGAHEGESQYAGFRGHQIAEDLDDRVESEGVRRIVNGVAFGVYEGGMLAVWRDRQLIRVRHNRLIVAAGAIEKPLVFERNDLPGVMLARGVQRLIHRDRVLPGIRAVIVGTDRRAAQIGCDLLDAGGSVAAVVLLGQRPPDTADLFVRLEQKGAVVLTSHAIASAIGRRNVQGVVAIAITDEGLPKRELTTQFECDLIVQAAGYQPMAQLLAQAGAKMKFDAAIDAFAPAELPPDVFAAGEVAGWSDLESILRSGKLSGAEAAASLDKGDMSTESQIDSWRQTLEAARKARAPVPVVSGPVSDAKKQFVCYCEDVTEKDLNDAINEGFDSIETLKRYSTISMGPCQGKMCTQRSVEICARRTGRSLDEVGAPTSRPPVSPVPLGVLAGRNYHSFRLSPLHSRHQALGATMMTAGQWYRPESYTSPEEEYAAVREGVGVIDVSTLGKLEVSGPDATTFLETIYTNRFAKLGKMRVRYGVICDESGVILDDGALCRLDQNRYFVTTTTGGVERVEDWMNWWAAAGSMKVWITNVTSAFASINVAGPSSRRLMRKVADFDVSGEAIPYMGAASGLVAGVDALVFRLGFTGELGYEIHIPTEYGVHVWDAILDVGRSLGVRPFGVEAQRRLRLEKRHLLVNVDTDALSNPFEAGMGWIVHLQKPEFYGRAMLAEQKVRPPRNKLVGFVIDEDSRVPLDGQSVVHDGHPVGRVTSSRHSPFMGRAIGLAWVPSRLSAEGTTIEIRTDSQPIRARVCGSAAFYDPEGLKLRS